MKAESTKRPALNQVVRDVGRRIRTDEIAPFECSCQKQNTGGTR
jgi:hypothetical protein